MRSPPVACGRSIMSCPTTINPVRALALVLLFASLGWAEQASSGGEGPPPSGPPVPGLTRELALLINEARPLLIAGKVAEARVRIAAYQGPDHPWLEHLRGDAAFAAGDHAGAVAAYRKVLQGDPAQQPPGTRLDLGRALAAAGDYAAAMDELTSVLAGGTAASAGASDIALLVSCQLASGAASQALSAAQLGRLRYPHDHRLARSELAALQATARWDELGRAAAALLKGDAGEDDRRLDWQVLLQAREHGADADEAAATAIAAWHAQAIPASRLAGDLQRAGLYARSLTAYRIALERETSTAALVLAASEVAAKAGEIVQARELLARLTPAESKRSDVRRLAAYLAARAGDRADARRQLAALIEAGEGDGATYLWAGRLAQDDGDDAAAIDAYQRAALDRLQTRSARLSLAILFGKHGRRDEAISQVRAVLDDDPSDRHASEILVWLEAPR
jgi:Tfp pilus assembly protein PilF